MIYMTHCVTACTTESTVYEDIAYPQRVHIFPDTYSRVKSGMSYPPHVMFSKVITPEVLAYVKNNPVKGKTAFLFAAGSQGWSGIGGRYDKNPDAELHYETKIPFITLTNIYAGRIASMFGVEDYVCTDASACASSLKILMDMQNLMFHYGFDRVIVLSGEDSVSIPSLEFFGDANACLLLKDEGERKPSAFDSVNYGFHVGQGAALTIFESEHAAMATPIARFLGAYTSAENLTNPLGQRKDGAGYTKAIEGALFVAKLGPDVVKLVKTHGTGTPANNVAEKTALTSILSEFIATSYKQRIGHTLSASGLLETGLLFEDIARGSIPAIPNRTDDDPVFISRSCPAPDGVVLSLAAGMGNVYSAALFEAVK